VRATVDLDSPGRAVGYLLVAHSDDAHAYSSIPVPVAVIAGSPGPRVLVVAGTHGDEWEGQLLVRDLVASLRPADVTGTLICLPTFNLPAADAARRCSPIDGDNMNRVFPGETDGGPTRMLADYVEHVLLPKCDYAIDLHSGGSATQYLNCAFLRIDDDERRTNEKLAAAETLGLPYTFLVDAAGEDRTLSAAADRQDVVMVATELSGAGRVDTDLLSLAGVAVRRLLVRWRALSPSAPEPRRGASLTEFIRFDVASAAIVTTEGILEPLAHLGDEVTRGEPIARVHHLSNLDATPETIVAPKDGVVAIVRAPPRVRPGDWAATIGARVDVRALRRGGGPPAANRRISDSGPNSGRVPK
jgi:predicted deacylase